MGEFQVSEEQKLRSEFQRIDSLPIAEQDKASLRKGLMARLEEISATVPVSGIVSNSNLLRFPETLQPEKPHWFRDYTSRFIPFFRSMAIASKTFTLRDGEITGIKIRKLVGGDFMFLASLVPAWLTHLKGDTQIFDPITGEPKLLSASIAIVSAALSEWDHVNHCPTGFSLSVLDTLVTLWATKNERGEIISSPFTIDDLLQSDPEEVIELVAYLYQMNSLFFKKLYQNSGITRDIGSILAGSLTLVTNEIKELAAQSIQMVQELTRKTKGEEDKNGSGGQASGGKTNFSRYSSPLKDSLQEKAS